MQFKVKDIGDEGVEVAVAVTAAWLARECPDLEVAPGAEGVEFRGRLERSGADYLLRGQLAGGLVTPCARCLEPATVPLAVDVSVIFAEREEPAADDEDDDDSIDAPDVLPFADGIIDLGGELRDEVLLALPQSPLCREDCAGLCPVCGGNRNIQPCDCVEKQRAAAGKFAGLTRLKS